MSTDQKPSPPLSRRGAFRLAGATAMGAVFACVETAPAAATGYGPCTSCGCPGFVAANSYPMTCQRCGHSWSVHQ
jgi:hypothetical protein